MSVRQLRHVSWISCWHPQVAAYHCAFRIYFQCAVVRVTELRRAHQGLSLALACHTKQAEGELGRNPYTRCTALEIRWVYWDRGSRWVVLGPLGLRGDFFSRRGVSAGDGTSAWGGTNVCVGRGNLSRGIILVWRGNLCLWDVLLTSEPICLLPTPDSFILSILYL